VGLALSRTGDTRFSDTGQSPLPLAAVRAQAQLQQWFAAWHRLGTVAALTKLVARHWATNWSGGSMKVIYPFLVAVFASALGSVSQPAMAQRGRDDEARRREAIENARRRDDDRRRNDDWRRNDDRRWDDDDPWNDDRSRDARPGRRRGQDEEWYRRQQARREEWCRRHRNDRRCDDFFRRGNQASWCWDRNRDGRCDNFDNRRDTRGVYRRNDNGPEWQRWLQSFGFDVREDSPLVVPR